MEFKCVNDVNFTLNYVTPGLMARYTFAYVIITYRFRIKR